MKKGDKKAQYYLFAAFVIVGIISGFVAILNYSKRSPSVRIYDIAEELEIESEAVWDYSKLKNDYQVDVFTKNFNDYIGEGTDIYFINDTDAYRYEKDELIYFPFQNAGGKIIVNISNEQYTFNAKPQGNFFFVMMQEIGGEKYVVTN